MATKHRAGRKPQMTKQQARQMARKPEPGAARRSTRRPQSKILADVPVEMAFQCCDGRTLRSMAELAVALETMTDDIFGYHVNGQRNDFYNWVSDVIEDQELADDLIDIIDRDRAAELVAERIAYLTDLLTED